jgi:16S rRNA (cytidine1402-2'-O)-methyltransferase
MPTLYIVATPIGNLSDISERAKATLSCVDVVLCEDTRVTGKLLRAYGIDTKMLSYHQHSGVLKTKKIIELLERGNDLALVTDAGTPAISDPGGKLIAELTTHFASKENADKSSHVRTFVSIPVPGACAAITALSVSGFPADEFVFLGFPPHKKGRRKFFDRVASLQSTVVIYESTHRILKTLTEIHSRMPNRPIMVGRELTKMHETIYRGVASGVTEALESSSIKGEFVIVLRAL